MAEAQGATGDCLNRRDCQGHWLGHYSVEDCWGRSLWGLGTAAARSPDEAVRQRCPRPLRARRPAAFAVGQVHGLRCLGQRTRSSLARPNNRAALDLLGAAAEVVGHAAGGAHRGRGPRLGFGTPTPCYPIR